MESDSGFSFCASNFKGLEVVLCKLYKNYLRIKYIYIRHKYIYICIYIYIYVSLYIYIYVCVCVCVWQLEGSSWRLGHHVPKCMSSQKAIVVIIGRAHCFRGNIYIILILLIWGLSTLCVVDIYIFRSIYIRNLEMNQQK